MLAGDYNAAKKKHTATKPDRIAPRTFPVAKSTAGRCPSLKIVRVDAKDELFTIHCTSCASLVGYDCLRFGVR